MLNIDCPQATSSRLVDWHAFASLDRSASWSVAFYVLCEGTRMVHFRPADLLVSKMANCGDPSVIWDPKSKPRGQRRLDCEGGSDSDDDPMDPDDEQGSDEGDEDEEDDELPPDAADYQEEEEEVAADDGIEVLQCIVSGIVF